MIKELHIFFAALTFYTRLPAPSWIQYDEAYLRKSPKYFPLIGWGVAATGIVVLILGATILPLPVAILLSMAATVLATGAFHEDGFADAFDAFGGGFNKEQVLEIMKDSRLGTYGTTALLLLFGLKFFALWEIAQASFPLVLAALWAGHTWSRFLAIRLVHTHSYVQPTDRSKVKPVISEHLTPRETFFSSLFPLASLAGFFHAPLLILAVLPLYVVKNIAGWYFHRRIGGYTGDCLGAVQQATELAFYLGILVLWNLL